MQTAAAREKELAFGAAKRSRLGVLPMCQDHVCNRIQIRMRTLRAPFFVRVLLVQVMAHTLRVLRSINYLAIEEKMLP